MKPKELIAVVFSTFILIVLGDGVVANVVLGPKLTGTAFNWNTICFGWCFAVVVAGYVTGGDNNPAVTLANAVRGKLPWSKVGPYIIAEVVGAFLGAVGVYLCYRDGLVAAGLPNVWTTGPGAVYGAASGGGPSGSLVGSYSMLTASITEFIGTMVLMFAVVATTDKRNPNMATIGALVVGFTVLVIGLCLGGPSGYSLNPARDFGPRILGVLVGTQGLFEGLYWLIPPVLVPCLGAICGGLLYDKFLMSE